MASRKNDRFLANATGSRPSYSMTDSLVILPYEIVDFGVDNLIDFKDKCNFPWLMSNVIDNETHKLLADGLEYVILERNGKKVSN